MKTNNSPWLHQLNRTRPVAFLSNDHHTEVAIIGGGIAGVSTAFYTLKNTDKKVVLVEATKIAHGATGHNGGFLASYFERTFSSLIEEFGLEQTAKAQTAMESSWDLLDEIRSEAQIQTPMWQFTGFAACATLEEVLVHLKNNKLRLKAGLKVETILVSETLENLNSLTDEQYKDLYKLVPQQEIHEKLETIDTEYIAILPDRKGCMNSALFCEELISYLLKKYPDRLTLAEHTPVRRLVLKEDHAVLDISSKQKITAQKVVLCTNGFEKINIINTAGPSINKKFHHLVRGIVGYMAGYIEELKKEPTEISYLPKKSQHGKDIYTEDPYFYLTRRPFKIDNQEHSLISIGGPEALMDDTNNYHEEHPYPDEAKAEIDNFLINTYRHTPKDKISYRFLWHGLMGFTPNGVRLIGPEPCNKMLLYNLGCNGVGLLPSIYGGLKISQHLSGAKVEPSIFDPRDSRVKIKKHR